MNNLLYITETDGTNSIVFSYQDKYYSLPVEAQAEVDLVKLETLAVEAIANGLVGTTQEVNHLPPHE